MSLGDTMKAALKVVIQAVLAVGLAGLFLPILLLLAPSARTAGPVVATVAVGLLFVALRLLWPSRPS
jgi:hypothetical protein